MLYAGRRKNKGIQSFLGRSTLSSRAQIRNLAAVRVSSSGSVAEKGKKALAWGGVVCIVAALLELEIFKWKLPRISH
jgi:hypothetical protein